MMASNKIKSLSILSEVAANFCLVLVARDLSLLMLMHLKMPKISLMSSVRDDVGRGALGGGAGVRNHDWGDRGVGRSGKS